MMFSIPQCNITYSDFYDFLLIFVNNMCRENKIKLKIIVHCFFNLIWQNSKVPLCFISFYRTFTKNYFIFLITLILFPTNLKPKIKTKKNPKLTIGSKNLGHSISSDQSKFDRFRYRSPYFGRRLGLLRRSRRCRRNE